MLVFFTVYSKPCIKQPLKKETKNWFSRLIFAKCRSKVLQNAPREHYAILSTLIKLAFVFKTFVLSFFEWVLKTGFTVSFLQFFFSPIFFISDLFIKCMFYVSFIFALGIIQILFTSACI